MNKAYKVIYNETTGTYVAVAEIATSHTKSDATIVTTAPNPQHTGPTGLRLKKMALSHLSVAALGVFTMMAMPAAHASWVNNANGGHGGAAANGDYGVISNGSNSIAIGSGTGSGQQAITGGNDSVAIGSGAKTLGENSVAIGKNAEAQAWSYAMGTQAQAFGNRGSAIAIGDRAYARSEDGGPEGNNAIAIGSDAIAIKSGIAIGNRAKAEQDSAIAIGWGANATGSLSGIAIGDRANAMGNNAIAIGGNPKETATFANGQGAVALGSGSNAQADGAVALGGLGGTYGGSEALDKFAVAIGADAHATASGAIAIGGNGTDAAQADGKDSLAFGTGSQTAARSVGGIAIGLHSISDADYATAIGPWAQAMQDHSMAIGANAFADGAYAMAVGDRNLALKEESIAIGLQNKVDAEKASSFGHRNLLEGYHDLAIGHDNLLASGLPASGTTMSGVNNAFGSENVIVGTENIATGNYNNIGGASYDEASLSKTANGNPLQNVTVNGNRNSVNSSSNKNTDTVVVGSSSTLFGTRNNTIGTYNRIGNSANSIEVSNANVLGNENVVNSDNSGIVGNNNTIDEGVTGSFILGSNVNIDASAATVTGTNQSKFDGSVALGNNSSVQSTVDTHEYTFAGKTYQFAGANPVGTVSVGDIGSERTITNLAAGRISDTSTDAINGSQLYAAYDAINNINTDGLNFLGNSGTVGHRDLGQTLSIVGATKNPVGITYDATNAATVGTYSAQNIQTVTDPTGNIQIQFAERPVFDGVTLGDATKNLVTINEGGININKGTKNIVISGDTVSFGGNVINNVAAGVSLTDAVNVSQLNNLGSSLTAAGLNFSDNKGNVSHRNLGQTLSIVGATVNPVTIAYDTTNAATVGTYSAQNVQTVTDKNGNMQIQFAERPVFDGVTLGDATKNLVTINEGGININKGTKNIVISGDTVSFGGNTLTNVAPGAITSTSTDAVNGSQLYTVNELASKGWNIQTNGDAATQVKPGDTVDIGTATGESNIKVTRNGNTIDFELNKNLDLGNTGSVVMGNTTVNNNGLTIKNGPSITINGIDAGSKTITNVAPGKNGTDGVNVDQLTGLGNSLTSAGLNFSDNKGNVSHRNLGQTLSIVGATVNPVTIAYDTTNAATVGTYSAQNIQTVTDKNGNMQIQFAERPVFDGVTLGDATKNLVTINEGGININKGTKNIVISGDTVSFGGNTLTNVAPGAITSTSTDAVNGSQLYTVNELASKGWNIQTNGDAATQVKPGDTVDIGTATGESNIKVTRNGNTIDFELNKNLDLGNTGSVVMGNTTVNNNGLTIKNGPSITINGIDAGSKTITNVAPGKNGTDGVNVDQLTGLGNSLTSAGLNFSDNKGNVSHRNLGQTLSIVGATVNPVTIAYDTTNAATVGTYSAQNIQTVTDSAGNIQIQFAERPVFDGVTLGDATKNLVTINEGGINVTGGGKTVVIAGDKVDFGGNTLTNVAPGAITSTSQDAVNGSQLYTVNELASKGWNIQTNGDTASQVHPGDTVDIGTAAGENNIKVTRNGNTIDFELSKNLDLGSTGSVVMGNTTVNNNGLTIKNGPSITINGIDAGGKTLTNVAPGINGTDGVNVDQLTNLGDSLTAAGLNFVGSDGVQVHRDLGSTLGIVGANKVNGTQYQGTVAGTAGTYSAKNVQTVTDPTTGNIQIQLAERPEFEGIKAGNTAGNIVNIDNSGINITGGGKTVVIAGDKVDFGGNTLTNVAPGAITNTSKDAVNGSQLYNVQAIASKGWNIQTNGDKASQVQPGDTVDIGTAAGENNIKVTRNGNTIDFELNKNLDLGNTGSVKMGDLTINNAGLVIKNGPSVTINGIDAGGKTITNVLPGKNGTDGVNVDQLNNLGNSLTAAGLNFVGSDGVQIHRDLGTTLGIVGANQVNGTQYQGTVAGTAGTYSAKNVQTVTDPTTGNIQIQLAERPEFEGIKAGNTAGNIVNIDNSGINITGGGKTVVIAGDKVDFGGNTLANVAPGAITSTSKDAVNGSQLYNVQAIATKGWNIQTNGDKASQVQPGDTVDIGTAAGENNIKVTRNGNTIDFELNKNLDLGNTGSVKMGDLTIDQAGLVIKNGPSITINGIDAGNKTITNVAPGVNGTDAVNVDQLDDVKNTAGKGWNIQTNGDKATQVKPGDTVDIGTTDGETNIQVSRNGNKIDFELNKNLDLGSTGSVVMGNTLLNNNGLTINGGPSITQNGIDAGNKTITNVAPGVGLTDAVNLSQLNQAITGAKYAGLRVENGSDIIAPNESLNIIGQGGTTVSYDKNTNTYTVSSKNGGTGTGSMDDWNVTGSDGKGGSVNVPITDGKNVDFAAGSKNVVVTPIQTADGAKVTVDVAQDLNLNSVTTKNADGSSTVVNGNGVTIKGKDGKNGASITQAGIDAGNQKITNVAAGTDATDAVNVSQLNAVSNNINNLSNRINEVEDNANAGTATAIAIANLPQAYEPGARVIAVAAGAYEGETGYAIGYSAISDGGNWIIKASGTGNSQQKFGAGAGVGYRWR